MTTSDRATLKAMGIPDNIEIIGGTGNENPSPDAPRLARRGLGCQTGTSGLSITHQTLQDAAVKFLHLKNYICASIRPARVVRKGQETYRTPWQYDGKGQVDIIAAYNKRNSVGVHPVLWIEVKVGKDTLRPDQRKWQLAIICSGGRHFILRPENWDLFVRWVEKC